MTRMQAHPARLRQTMDALDHAFRGMNFSSDEKPRLAALIDKHSAEQMDDPALLRMSLPVRARSIPTLTTEFMQAMLASPRNQADLRSMLGAKRSSPEIIQTLFDRGDQRTHSYVRMQTPEGLSVGSGSVYSHVMVMRHALDGAPIYRFSDELVQLLRKTEISDDIAVSELAHLPASSVFLEMGSSRDTGMRLHNPSTGWHELEGALVGLSQTASGSTKLEVTLCGSPLGHTELGDDHLDWFILDVEPGLGLADALTRAFADSGQDPKIQAEALSLIAKAILFLRMPQATLTQAQDGKLAQQAFNRAVSGAHKRKAAKRLRVAYDHWAVGVARATGSASDEQGTQSYQHLFHVNAHWRNGHFRNQRYGQGLAFTKVIWIEPVLVNAHLL